MFDILSRSNTTKLSRNDGYIDKNSFHIAEMAIIESYQQDINLLNSIISSKNSQMQFIESGIDEYKIHQLHEGTIDKIKTAILKMWNWLINKAKDIFKFIQNGIRKIFDNTNKMIDAYGSDLNKYESQIGELDFKIILQYMDLTGKDFVPYQVLPDTSKDIRKYINSSIGSYSLEELLKIAKDEKTDNCSQQFLYAAFVKYQLHSEDQFKKYVIGDKKPMEYHAKIVFKYDYVNTLKELKDLIGKFDKKGKTFINNLESNKKSFEKTNITDDKIMYNFNKVFSAYKQFVLNTFNAAEKMLYDYYKLFNRLIAEAIKKMKTLPEYKSKNESYLFDNSSFELY